MRSVWFVRERGHRFCRSWLSLAWRQGSAWLPVTMSWAENFRTSGLAHGNVFRGEEVLDRYECI